MAASIRADCPDCGPVETPIAEAMLRLVLTSTAAPTALEFRCPRCSTPVTTAVGERAVRLLMQAGISVVGDPADTRRAGAGGRERGRR
jgi:predicted RNA-binding Zn-ribbon protein involved in translation (DUF1610 family)